MSGDKSPAISGLAPRPGAAADDGSSTPDSHEQPNGSVQAGVSIPPLPWYAVPARGPVAELRRARWAVDHDQDERAEAALEQVRLVATTDAQRMEAWVLEARLALRRNSSPPEPPNPDRLRALQSGSPALACEVWTLLAALARRLGDLTAAADALQAASRLVVPGSAQAGSLAVERAAALADSGQVARAAIVLQEAMRCFEAAAARLELGRALMAMADLAASGTATNDSPATWLARAHTAFGAFATWRDRASLRAAFRKYGRRVPDHVLSDAVAERVDIIDRAAGDLDAAVHRCADDVARAAESLIPASAERSLEHPILGAIERLIGRVGARVADARRVGAEMAELAAAIAAERNQLRELLLTLAEASQASSVADLAATAVRVARDLVDADCVLLLRAHAGSLAPMARAPESCEPPADVWKPAVDACLRTRPTGPPAPAGVALRRHLAPLGPAFAVPVQSATFSGAMYVDRLARGGQFDETAYQVVSLLAAYLGQTLGMLQSRDAEERATAEVQAAFRAIRDGVLSIDADGVVRATNAAAVRMLNQGELVGRRLGDIAVLAPLVEVLVPPRSVDAAVVPLRHGRLVVTARAVEIPGLARSGVVATLVEHERARRAAMRFVNVRPRFVFEDIVGVSRPVQEAIALARHAASLDSNILITGESGTGKEVFAQAIHTGGARADEPFVGINCAALPRDLLESELFGYEHGSFTGARSEGAVGKFELAGEGTLLLDEIGDMPLDMQAKLLRVVQERVVVRIGGAAERPVRARIIATTHRHLEDAVERGTFRLDLLFRLRVLHVHLPPLRERRDDIVPLAEHFIQRVAQAQGKAAARLGPRLHDTLLAHDWPGNVRELANVVEREVGMADPGATVLDELHGRLSVHAPRDPAWDEETPSIARFRNGRLAAGMATGPPLIVPMAEVERRVYLDALAACGGHVGKAASALSVSRSAFYDKLKRWGVRVEKDGK